MNKYISIIIGLAFMLSSCIDVGLDELPLHSNAEIVNVTFEYRYSVENEHGYPMLAYVILSNAMTTNGNEIENVLAVPPPSGDFTAELASQVDLTNIVGYVDLSDAATIEPIDGAPELGTVADFSQPRKYRVTAADGTSKVWTLVTSMN